LTWTKVPAFPPGEFGATADDRGADEREAAPLAPAGPERFATGPGRARSRPEARMQLAHVVIENFRQFEHLELDFTDSLGRVRDVSVLVGPNGSGKTTVLDAIASALGPATGFRSTRLGWTPSPRTVVRPGARSAKVTCRLRFSTQEVEVAREAATTLGTDAALPSVEEMSVTWTYPDPDARQNDGIVAFAPTNAGLLTHARFNVALLMGAGASAGFKPEWFKRAGRAVTFDQQRLGLSRSVAKDNERVAAGVYQPQSDVWTEDARKLLIELAVKSQIPGPGEDHFQRVKERYAEVCAPRSMIGARRDEADVVDIWFSDGKNEYDYEGVSSGEAMVLLFLIKMVSERIHSSIVLVDEIELHQHPVWQRRLLYLLPRMGESNQIIATTHSDYLREVLPRGAVRDVTSNVGVIPLGDLDDEAEANAGHE
jgi:predicted ATPase